MAPNNKDPRKPDNSEAEEMASQQNPNPFSELAFNTYEELLEDRIILINGDLKEDLIERATIPLIKMAAESKDPIQMYVNSFGGSIHDSQAVVDVMTTIDNPIITMAFGKAMSAGFDLFLAGDYRISYPNTVFMAHSGSASLGLQTLSALNVEAKLHEELFKRWAKFYAARTKISEKEWLDLLNGSLNRYFFPEEALTLGIAHHVVSAGKKPDLKSILKLKW
jgi:ATP-dependent Clp protease, protease subunit